jgi:hypothetical protein
MGRSIGSLAHDHPFTPRRRRGALAVLLLLGMALAPLALARQNTGGDGPGGGTGGGGEPTMPRCLAAASGSLRASPATVGLGSTTTLSWTAAIPSGCTTVRIYLGSESVSPVGFKTVQPLANATYRLRARLIGVGEAELATLPVGVVLPPDSAAPGRQLVTITANNQAPLLVQALGTPHTTVVVSNDVQLDLSYRHDIAVADGVILRGGRSKLLPGPRLFTTTRQPVLFGIVGDNVRITGVRIEGPDMGADERYGTRAIQVVSKRGVRIDHNEISGWTLAGIQVWDPDGAMHDVAPFAVHIHDNYIHHNQAVGGDGYGVTVGDGGYALIERNVFDWNRHAIEGDGSPGTGYVATANLVLEHGGLHRWIPFPGFWVHTHQFDMHGTEDCGVWDIFSDALANCGDAGLSMFIRQNTFFYASDHAIKLRGTPEVGMFVGQNVFANHLRFEDAATQEETGLVEEPGNVFGYNGKLQLGSCDFDGDGVLDSFMATGVTWWYASGGTMPWSYLHTSTARLPEVVLGYFDGDERCDVKVGDTVFSGGTNFWPHGGVVVGGGVLGGGVYAQP